MPRFAANLTMMYTEHSFVDRFAAAARDGFKAVEYLFPYEHPAATLAAELKEHGLRQVLFNSPAGDWKAGERGIAALPGREQEFRDGFLQALEYAQVLQCPSDPRDGGHSTERNRSRAFARRVHSESCVGRGASAGGGRGFADRADRVAQHAGLLSQSPGRSARDRRRKSALPTSKS